MKKVKKRVGVYETNSSSSHTISIASVDKQYVLDMSLIPDESDGNIYLSGGEFGWAYEKFNDAETKANYCAEYANGKEYETEILKEVIKKQTGAEEVIIKCSGYIDHQSYDVAKELFDSEAKLRNFIFNLNSWLFTGNDNSESTFTFYDVPEYKDGKIIEPQYDYQLIIKGLNTDEYKFKREPNYSEIEDAIGNLLQYVSYTNKKGLSQKDSYSYSFNEDKEDVFEYESWRAKNYNLLDIKNKTFSLFNSKKLSKKADEIYEKEHGKEKGKNYWQDIEKIKINLIKEKDNDFIIKFPFEILSLKNKRVKERIELGREDLKKLN